FPSFADADGFRVRLRLALLHVLPPESARLSPETGERVSGEPVDLPAFHRNRPEPAVEPGAGLFPRDPPPPHPPAAGSHCEPREMRQKRLADPESPVCGRHE